MKVLKIDPTTITELQSWAVFRLKNPSGSKKGASSALTASESASIRESWNSAFDTSILNNINLDVNSDDPHNRSRAYTILLDSDGVTPPRPTLSLYQKRVPVINKGFYARRDAGEIVVSNYLRGRLSVTSYPAEKVGPMVRNKQTTLPLENFFDVPGFTSEAPTRFFLTNELYINAGSSRFKSAWYYSTTRAYLPALHVDPASIFAQMSGNTIDKGLVGRQLADMNKGTLDVLTTMAELPKLITSIINGLALVARLLKSAKRKEISLSAAFDRRKKLLDRRYQEDMSSLLALKNKRKHPKLGRTLSNKMFIKKRNRMSNTYQNALKASVIEFNDAVASIWMNFRYNIMPAVYTINDIEDTLAFKRTYLTRRNGYEKTLFVVVGGEKHDYTCNSRIFIKRKIQQTGSSLNTASANFAVTAWELVPLSWVIDWFINIGDMVAAFSVQSSFSEQGATWAERKTIDSDVTNLDGQRVTIQGFIYNRQVIDPIQLTCLDFKYDMNADRYRDGLALSWNAIRSNLVHGSTKRK